MKLILIKWYLQRVPHVIRNILINIRFPFLIPKYLNITHSWYYSIPEGWRKAFGIQLCKEIKKSLKENKCNNFYITDIKEKFGELNIYEVGAPFEVCDIIHKYEYISSHTCIYCGRIATRKSEGYILPLCDKCGSNFNSFKQYYKDYDFYGWKN